MSLKSVGLALAMTVSAAHAQAQVTPCDGVAQQGDVISLARAIELATATDLRPALAKAEIKVARSERAIAALRPADTVSFDIEDFPGIGLASNVDSLQLTGRFSRVWERGGKREARLTLANSSVGIAETLFKSAQFEIRSEIEILYAEAALAERRVALACDRVLMARELEASVQKRVDAARDPLLAGAKATSDRLQAEAETRRYDAQAQNIRGALGAYWGANQEFRIDPQFLTRRLSLPSLSNHEIYSPTLERLNAERDQAVARIELERTQSIPDVTWSVGVRKFGVEDDLAILGGVSIPLGSKQRSHASVTKASADQIRIEVERQAVRQQLLRNASEYRRSADSALEEMEEIDSLLLPSAINAVELARDGYSRGAFSYLDVVDAQRSVAALREERLIHLRTYILNETALSRLAPSGSLIEVREEIQQ
ncbi:MAG: TolC family protein [Litorimonas sp.]